MNFPRCLLSTAALWIAGLQVAPAAELSSNLLNQALAATRAQRWPAARSAWEALLQQDPDNPATLSNLGKVQFQLADHQAARTSLEKATALKPELSDSWLALGLVYLELQAPMMAVSAMTRGVAENPADPRAHNSLAIVLKRIGWTSGAEAELQKSLDLDPTCAEAHFNLAVLCLERKPPSLEMAQRHYLKARSLGAAPDEVVEKQIRGESALQESEDAPPPSPESQTPRPPNGASPTPPSPPAPAKRPLTPKPAPRKSSPS